MNNINRKYTNEIVKEKLLEYGYHLCSNFISIKKDVQFYDNDGYRYCCPLMDLFHENKIPKCIAKTNPYVIQNIRNYIKLNKIDIELLSDIYEDAYSLLKWKCYCGNIFYLSWNKFQDGYHKCEICREKDTVNKRIHKKQKEINSFCDENNFKLIKIIRDENYRLKEIHISDQYGYKYVYYKFSDLKKHRAFKFHASNPYTIYNLNRWLNSIGLCEYVCIDKEYKNNYTKMKFVHLKCGNTFSLTLGKFQRRISEKGICMCPHCYKRKIESYHASILKQIFMHEYKNVVPEDKSCTNPKTGHILPTDIVCYDTKTVVEIQSSFHDKIYKQKLDLYKKEFWERKGFIVYTPDIRDYTIIGMIQLFFPSIKEIPDYVDLYYNEYPDYKHLQDLLDSGLSAKQVSEVTNINVNTVRSYLYNGLLKYPPKYKEEILGQKKICKLDKNYNLLDTYENLSEVNRNGYASGTVRRVLIKKQKYSYGFVWMYESDYKNTIKDNI